MPDFHQIPIVFLLWVYSRTSKAGSVLLAWVSHPQEWHKFQIAAMGLMWTGAAWCLNSTTWTVLSSEVHWNLSSHEEISPVYQCQLKHSYEEHLIISLYVCIWIDAFDFADNWCDFAVTGSVCCAEVLNRSELWNETVIRFIFSGLAPVLYWIFIRP